MGFRAAFALAFFGPLLWLAVPTLHKVDPLWTEGRAVIFGLIGVFVAGLGAMVAFAAQMSMGSSWRVGVVGGETGDLVSGGLGSGQNMGVMRGVFCLRRSADHRELRPL
jgi:hypothetical protein